MARTTSHASKEARDAALNHARRRLILDGAWRVFSRDGLDGATMRAIASETGCTTGAIYPLFASKELIYADLLAESLDRLHAEVEGSLQSARSIESKLKAGALAFMNYYRDRPDEVALGLYLWHGLKPRGLSYDLDTNLNQRLKRTLDLLLRPFLELGFDEPQARLEVSTLFAFQIGALVVHQTGRLRMLDTDIDAIASKQLDALSERLRIMKRQGRD